MEAYKIQTNTEKREERWQKLAATTWWFCSCLPVASWKWIAATLLANVRMWLRWLPATAAAVSAGRACAIRVTLALEDQSLFDFGWSTCIHERSNVWWGEPRVRTFASQPKLIERSNIPFTPKTDCLSFYAVVEQAVNVRRIGLPRFRRSIKVFFRKLNLNQTNGSGEKWDELGSDKRTNGIGERLGGRTHVHGACNNSPLFNFSFLNSLRHHC